MSIHRETRDVFVTSDQETFTDENVARVHEAKYQLKLIIESEWFHGLTPDDVVENLIENRSRVIKVLIDYEEGLKLIK